MGRMRKMRRTVDHIWKGLVAKFAGDPVNESGAGTAHGFFMADAEDADGCLRISSSWVTR
jgi:hypothetical protein